jgi:hypothetical protein
VRVASQAAAGFIVVDEIGLNLDLTPHYSRAPRGQRAVETVPRNTPLNTTLIGPCSLAGMGPSMMLTGAVDSAAFEAYLDQVLGPTLREGQIVLLSNLSVHTSARVAELVAARGCTVWYLPTVLAFSVAD